MLDPLVASDVGEPVQDGLPHTLEEDIEKYGLTHFKIKIGGDSVADQSRLRQIAAFLASRGLEAAPFTLDANEQYQDLDSLVQLLETLASDPETARFMDGLLFVEQPLPRSETFDETQREPLARLSAVCGVIIDEADYGVHAFRRALELGYQGVSIKNCKGVFRALINCGLAEVMGDGAFQSAEDLTNTGIIPLQQNLATLGVLNQAHVEMNGHHYFRGLDHLPAEEVRWALSQRPGLYEPLGDGACLLVKDGRVDLTSVQGVGFGGVEAMAFEGRQEAEAWLESVQ
jgi:L-alanine-DL-glutamate epimerase-like enolase superfamily enzyme